VRQPDKWPDALDWRRVRFEPSTCAIWNAGRHRERNLR